MISFDNQSSTTQPSFSKNAFDYFSFISLYNTAIYPFERLKMNMMTDVNSIVTQNRK